MTAGIIALPCRAQTADASARAHHAPSVVMMIGGMTTNDEAAVAAKPVSIAIPPGNSISRAAARPLSASAVSRVVALSPLIDEASRLADVDSALLMAVIDVESGGNPQAVSPKGATGLMQLMPATGARHGASNLFDPRQNIAAGARYLKALIGQFGDLSLALAAYNAGEGAVQKYGGQIPPYVETMNYVPRVMARYQWYRNTASSRTAAMVREVSNGARESVMIVGSGIGD
ncbi:lytic transglycosylase domain-containing protein [Paraburkholderia bryophila]